MRSDRPDTDRIFIEPSIVNAAATPPSVLTIAGSDSGGGAGVQADLKTFGAFATFGTSAITAVTAQNTVGVSAVHVLPVDVVAAQIESVLTDFRPKAVKTGMLATDTIVDLVADLANQGRLPNLVVDPVMVATSGDRLLNKTAERSYLTQLFTHAEVITPNAVEAGILLGRPLETAKDLSDAARELGTTGARFVVVKGGHIDGDNAVDVVWDGSSITELVSARYATQNTHGTGCTFAAAVAAELANGRKTMEAIVSAKSYISDAIGGAKNWSLGEGHGPVDHAIRLR